MTTTELGPLPEPWLIDSEECGTGPDGESIYQDVPLFTADQMRAYAMQERAAERELAAQHIAALEQEIARQKEVIASVNARCDHLGMSLRDIKADRDSWAQQASDRTQDAVDLVMFERERCAKLCESLDEPYLDSRYDYRRGVLDCAEAIRKGNG